MKNITSHKHFPAYCILGLAAALTLTACEKKADEQQAPAKTSQAAAPETSPAPTAAPAQDESVTPVQATAIPTAEGQKPLTLDGFMTTPNFSTPAGVIQDDSDGSMPVQFGEALPYTLD